MNILILNWRDPKNPKSGGAEKLNMHIIKPLIERGDIVTWYSMAVEGLSQKEIYEGVTIIRRGSPLIHLLLWPILYWSGKLGKPDLIIDSIHGTGYLSSVVAPGKRKIILICEVAQNIWDEMYSFPINKLGKLWEKVMFKFYSSEKFWTISQSTKDDLIKFGVNGNNVDILPMGFDAVKLNKIPPKAKEPTALFVGRLAEMKGVKDAIKAITEVNKTAEQKWKLHIIGRGEKEYEAELKKLVTDLSLIDYVRFFGFVDEKEKFEEMAKAWVILVPSSREGWGMIVPEANSVGTFAIGYNVPGLKDVLTKYLKDNMAINPSYKDIAQSLSKIKSPSKIAKTIESGWGELYRFIRRQI